ncbi:hypothetical protein GC584_10990 [Corynebacterium sp. zg912]|uniref:O-antigen ligase family protein n=1 Tax=Corynebacterium wankanglinii TaxID=2735136 RepID=A0A7V8UW49_9CORY|nr:MULTISPECIES: O-antigen ligase family protein [Corynebacterium]MBA1838400.1 O-antigen ligase family protein [Corynebacterium wankanglinii]MCR5929913.1 hypothetical protein [Corynebacterium sp. zg912]
MSAFFYALTATIAYLFNPYAGFSVFCAITAMIHLRADGSPLYRNLKLLAISMPLFMAPVLPGLPVMGSWTSLFLVVVAVQLARRRFDFGALDLYLLVVFVLGTVVTTLQSNGGVREVYYSTQIALLILPPSVALIARKHRESLVTRGEQDHLLFAVAGAIAASGTAVVVQWLLATRFGLSLGHIAFFQNRVSYDLLIPAYSALSALLSIGLPLGPVLWRTGRKLAAVTLPVLSGISIVINSSRTGFVAGAIGLAIILLFPPRGVNRVGNVLLLIPASAFVIWLFNKVTDSSRFKSASLWSANGRFETYTAGYELWTQYPRYFLFGRGYANYPTMPPHNFFLETLVCSGLIVALAVAVVFVRFIWFTWGTSWCYLIATYLTAGMFFSGFYNFKPLAILLIIGICCANPGETWRGGQETSKSTTKNTSPPTISLKHRPQNQMIRQADVN